jgi:hypothetical protein
MKILVCGSRSFTDEDTLVNYMNQYFSYKKDIVLISGGADGADTFAEQYAIRHSISKEIYHPNWDKYGLSAGFIRSECMVDCKPDFVIAFWNGISTGTLDTLKLAARNKIKTLIIYH